MEVGTGNAKHCTNDNSYPSSVAVGGGSNVCTNKDDCTKGNTKGIARPVVVIVADILLNVANTVQGKDTDKAQQQKRDRALNQTAII